MTALDALLAARRRALEEELADYDLPAATRRLASRIAGEELAAVLDQHAAAVPPGGIRSAAGDGAAAQRNAEHLLESCCLAAVQRKAAAELIARFPHDYTPAGATAFACLLYLTGRHNAAAFWWRYAAGADDADAARMLALLHWSVGDPVTADLWMQRAASPPPSLSTAPRQRDTSVLVARTEPAIRVVADDPDCGEVCLPRSNLGPILAACHR